MGKREKNQEKNIKFSVQFSTGTDHILRLFETQFKTKHLRITMFLLL